MTIVKCLTNQVNLPLKPHRQAHAQPTTSSFFRGLMNGRRQIDGFDNVIYDEFVTSGETTSWRRRSNRPGNSQAKEPMFEQHSEESLALNVG